MYGLVSYSYYKERQDGEVKELYSIDRQTLYLKRKRFLRKGSRQSDKVNKVTENCLRSHKPYFSIITSAIWEEIK